MTPTPQPNGNSVSQQEFNSMRQNVKLLASQVKNGRVDGQFLALQVEKLGSLFDRLEVERQHARQGARFEALYNVSRILGASLDLQTVLDQVMDAILQLTRAERGFLMLRDKDGGLEVKAARNLDQQTLDGDQFHYSRTIANEVLDSGKAIVTTNASEDPRFAGQASILSQSLRSIMATPLHARGDVIGVAYVDSRVVSDLFDDADLNALEALAGQAAIAIENAQLFEQTDQELASTVSELTQLRRMDRLLNETLNPSKAVAITLEWAARLSNSVSGYLGLLEGKGGRVATMRQYGELGAEKPTHLNDAYDSVQGVISTGKPITEICAVQGEDRCTLIVPIRLENKVFGVVVLHKPDTNPYTEHEIDIAGRVVNRASFTIENARLYTAVQEANRAKSEFVGVVAHDLKVPMTSILGYANLVKMIGDDHSNLVDRQGEFLQKITDTVRRMEVLVSDLSDISRIESGHFYMDEIRVTVRRIIESVKDNTLTQIQERNHTLAENVEPDLPDMYVDYYRLLQVLTNLVSNAYKYTPDGGTITLAAKRDDDRIRFTVSDTGIGLTDEQIAKLGTKFWRAEDEYTRSQPGTGLGFAITSSLVELMGSQIDIKSKVGEGSQFSFSVAVATGKNDPDDTQPLPQIG